MFYVTNSILFMMKNLKFLQIVINHYLKYVGINIVIAFSCFGTWHAFKHFFCSKCNMHILIWKYVLHNRLALLLHTGKTWHLKYSVFQGFRQAKSANGGSILSSNQFLILPQLHQKMMLTSKVVKVDSKIIISLPKI